MKYGQNTSVSLSVRPSVRVLVVVVHPSVRPCIVRLLVNLSVRYRTYAVCSLLSVRSSVRVLPAYTRNTVGLLVMDCKCVVVVSTST